MTVMVTHETNLFNIMDHPPTCPSCHEVFSYRYQLEWHYKWKHHGGGTLFICSDCNESSMEEPKFKLHVSTHDNHVRHACEKCGFKFVTELKLKLHQLVHRKATKGKDSQTCHKNPDFDADPSKEEVVPPCRGCFSRQSFSVRHAKKNRFSGCSYAVCIKEVVCKHGNRWAQSL